MWEVRGGGDGSGGSDGSGCGDDGNGGNGGGSDDGDGYGVHGNNGSDGGDGRDSRGGGLQFVFTSSLVEECRIKGGLFHARCNPVIVVRKKPALQNALSFEKSEFVSEALIFAPKQWYRIEASEN
ncbi:Hypothetical predicted protein [Octopus vulgaris]|uniref:Uncharacterized protein n=1 Tax=Octopus vulgaris TaxID=6645 RepID=A0AA36BGG4_OCTVU|nr:Hypothetical predicted protein [Octopus vulgaris]